MGFIPSWMQISVPRFFSRNSLYSFVLIRMGSHIVLSSTLYPTYMYCSLSQLWVERNLPRSLVCVCFHSIFWEFCMQSFGLTGFQADGHQTPLHWFCVHPLLLGQVQKTSLEEAALGTRITAGWGAGTPRDTLQDRKMHPRDRG